MEDAKRRSTDRTEGRTTEAVDRATTRAMEHVAEARLADEQRRHLAFAPDAPQAPIPRPVRSRILVVDDEPMILRLVDAALTMAGYEVVPESTGAAALERLAGSAGAYELVITNTRMPDMSGWQLIAEIQRRWPAQRVLRVSGYYATDSEGPSPAVDESAVAFLPKPFLPEELVRHVTALLTR